MNIVIRRYLFRKCSHQQSRFYLKTLIFLSLVGNFCSCSDEKETHDEDCEHIDIDTDTEFDFSPCGERMYAGSFSITNAESIAELATYTSVEGNLKIEDTADLTNLDGLESLLCVGRNLVITSNSALQNINGLANLIEIGGDVKIGDYQSGNAVLANVDGLGNLTMIGGHLLIEHNSALENLDGLSRLVKVGDFISVFGNPSLESIKGIDNIDTVNGFLNIAENENLPTCEATNLRDKIGTECRDICIRLNLVDSCSDDDEECWYDGCEPGDDCDDY